jgi:glycosyltransferase involved in cell wall biosynthesis
MDLVRRLRQRRPDIVHGVTPKGVLYGGIAARISGVPAFVAAVSGQGYAFTDGERGLNRTIARWAWELSSRYAFGHRNRRVIVQNSEDRLAILRRGLARPEQTVLLAGSGVDLPRLTALPLENKERMVLMPARMLRDKGVFEFATAARILRARHSQWRFVLAGSADHDNPSRVDERLLRQWHDEGILEWLGHVDNLLPLYAKASIVCLPSYREGMPKVLLEAAATGCAVITSDVTGCREAIECGVTGDVVPVRDALALANAIETLIEDPDRRLRYGRAGRDLARARFGIDRVIASTLNLYDELLQR